LLGGKEHSELLNEYIDIFRRRRNIVLQAFALAFGVSVVIALFLPPAYQAKALLLVDAPSYKINQVDATNPLSELFMVNQTYKIETQVRLLQSREILTSTAKKLRTTFESLPIIKVKSLFDTDIIEVTVNSPNPVLAADTANILLQTYIDDVAGENSKQIKSALAFTKDGAKKAQQDLVQAERQLKDFKLRYKVTELDKNRDSQISAVDDLKVKYEEIQRKLASAQSEIREAKQQLAMEPKTDSTVMSDSADLSVQTTENQIASMEAERAGLLTRYTVDNDRVIALDARIAAHRRRLAEQRSSFTSRNERKNPLYDELRDRLLQNEVTASGLETQSAEIVQQMAAARQRLESFPSWEMELSRLQRQLDISKANYALLTAKREDLRLREQASRVPARIMEQATPPDAPTRSRLQYILLGAFIGLALGLLLALLQEYLDDRIGSLEEAERVLQLPSLGVIPLVEEAGIRLMRSRNFSPIAESYRSLRTNINFASVDNPIRTLMVTSTSPGEGKSMTTSNLATVISMDGKRVILVDTDLRRPTIHKLFGLRKKPGLTDVLVGTHTISQVLQSTDVPDVRVITAGTQAPNPAELLGSEAMAHFIEAIREVADFVLFDAPPMLAVSDPALLSPRVDGVLFVVSHGETKRGAARQAMSLLTRARANVMGTVLNKVDTSGRSNYGNYYYSSYAPIPGSDDDERESGAPALVDKADSDESSVPLTGNASGVSGSGRSNEADKDK